MDTKDLVKIFFDAGGNLNLFMNKWLLVLVFALPLLLLLVRKLGFLKNFFADEIELNIPLGNFGRIKLKSNNEVRQIAHVAWAELTTRKAGILFDERNDVIVEVYDSWYQLFKTIRELVKTVPACQLKNENTKKLVNVLVNSLNVGLRPHLTIWQAKFRKWYAYELQKENNCDKTPQEIQKNYSEYDKLTKDLLVINQQVVDYTNELKKLF